MERRANYEIIEQGEHRIVIRDLGPWDLFLTVTNDAERVVEELAPVLKGRRLLYYDSDGELDELMVSDGKFAGFAPAQPTD